MDRLQDSFLKELGVSKEDAFIHFNLAPLPMRRDIAILGLLHRTAIGRGAPQFQEIFKRRPGSLRLVDPLEGVTASMLMKRSIWGAIRVYNKLGNSLSCSDVKGFQFLLQERAKSVVAKKLLPDWDTLYSPR